MQKSILGPSEAISDMRYRIAGWVENYETSDSRRTERLTWVKTPNKHDSLAFRRMMRNPDGASIFGVWNMLLQISSRLPQGKRGELVQNDRPLNAEDLSIMTGVPSELVEKSLAFLSSPGIGWILAEPDGNDCKIQNDPDAIPMNPDESRHHPDESRHHPDSSRLHEIREHDITGEKNMSNLLSQNRTDFSQMSIPKSGGKKMDPNFFEFIWRLYPLKEGKARARICIQRAISNGRTMAEIQTATERYALHIEKSGDLVMNGSTFFGTRWMDWIDENPRTAKRKSVDEIFQEVTG